MPSVACAELTAFLVEHGVFASVAGKLVKWLLADARKTVAEAKVYALALVYSQSSVGLPRRRNKEPMNPKIVIRNETDADASAIAEVTVAALRPWRSAITRSNASLPRSAPPTP